MHEVLTPKLTREELVRRLENLQARCAGLVKLAREGMAAQGAESKVPEVLTPRMVAERWAMSDKGVYNLIRSGKLRAFKLGGKLLRVTRAAVEECERAPASAPAEDDPALSRDREGRGRTHLDPLTRAKLRNLRERFTP